MQVPLSFPSSGGIALDGVLIIPHELPPPYPGVALCHAHPALGGQFQQAAMVLTARALERRGIASLRFNLRGVGESQGIFTMGRKEPEDARAALRLLRAWKGIDGRRLGLMGWAFGATVATKAAAQEKRVRAMALAAPPPEALAALQPPSRRVRRLVLVGEGAATPATGEGSAPGQPRGFAVERRVLAGADHSLAGHEEAAASAIAEFFANVFFAQG